MPGSSHALFLLALAMLLAMTTWFSATAVLPQLRTAWTLTTVQASFLTIVVQVGFVVGALVSAFFNLVDIIPARTLILLGALGAAAVNLLLVGAHSVGPAIGLRFLTGAFLAGVYPPGLKAMSTWFRVGRGTALGVMVGALTLGSAAPQFLNGIGGTGGRSGNGVVLAACLGMEEGRKSLADRAPGRTLASTKRAERPAVR